jgi:hypothetical protein
MKALIGTGTVGQSLLRYVKFDSVFKSENLEQLSTQRFDTVVVAAPSGNRLAINQDGTHDLHCVNQIVRAVQRSECKQVILFSSVDAVVCPDSLYGRNRRHMEQQLSQMCDSTIYRLSGLVGSDIKKNLLYDIKHQQYLQEVDAAAWNQWCLLDDLHALIDDPVPGKIQNLVSEPIQNSELLMHFCSGLKLNYTKTSTNYNLSPWIYTRQQIFDAMQRYLT